MADRKYYCFCDSNCKFETMTKEQILTAIMQAVNNGVIGDIDAGFVQTVKTIDGTPLRFFVGDQSKYEALTDKEKQNLYAIITNDTTKEGIEEAIAMLRNEIESIGEACNRSIESANARIDEANSDINNIVDGGTKVKRAEEADFAKVLKCYLKNATITERGLYMLDYSITSDNGAVVNTCAIISVRDLEERAHAGDVKVYDYTFSAYYEPTTQRFVVGVNGEINDDYLRNIRKIADYVL